MTSSLLRFLCATAGLGLASLAGADTTSAGLPLGVISSALAVGNRPLAFPLIREEKFTGLVAANSGTGLSFTGGNVGAALTAGAKYYLEVVTGPLEGERLDLDTAATLVAGGSNVVLQFGVGTASTAPNLAANVLAGARAVVRRHVTLGTLAPMFTPTLVGNNSAALADGVQLYVGSVLTTYYLRGDGATWRESGKTVDESNRVVPPDTSLLFQLRSGAKRWTLAGAVRSNVFLVPLTAGTRAFATGFPVDLSPQAVGAAVDLGVPAGVRWTGSNVSGASDVLRIYDESAGAFKTYALRADGTSWYLTGGSVDFSGQTILGATGMIVLTRLKPDPDYLIIRPFSL